MVIAEFTPTGVAELFNRVCLMHRPTDSKALRTLECAARLSLMGVHD